MSQSESRSGSSSWSLGLLILALIAGAVSGLWKSMQEHREGDGQTADRELEEEQWLLEEERWQAMLPVEILTAEGLPETDQFRVIIRGEVIGELTVPLSSVPIQHGAVSDLSEIQIQPRIPDGWVNIAWDDLSNLRVESTRQFTETGTVEGDAPAISLYASYLPTVEFLVDNRNHSAVRLRCGELEVPVSADTYTRVIFPAPRNAAHADFLIDDELVGSLPLAGQIGSAGDRDTDPEAHMLVDTSSARRYRREVVNYGDSFGFDGGSDPVYDSGQKLQLLSGAVSHLIDGAPESIEVFDGMFMDSRSELVEIDR